LRTRSNTRLRAPATGSRRAERLGTAILVGREDRVLANADAAGIDLRGRDAIEIHNARPGSRCRAPG
jgi:phosphotransacetylase